MFVSGILTPVSSQHLLSLSALLGNPFVRPSHPFHAALASLGRRAYWTVARLLGSWWVMHPLQLSPLSVVHFCLFASLVPALLW